MTSAPFFARKRPGIVLCGGAGSRLWPLTLKKQKAMIPVLGQPAIFHVLTFWQQFCDSFLFVVKHAREELMTYLRTLPLTARFVEPDALRGIADGLSYARPFLTQDQFVVILGDCLCQGSFAVPDGMVQGVSLRATPHVQEIRQSFSVEIDEATGLVSRVVEKPAKPPNDLCGLGFYFFDQRVFDYISKTPPSSLRGEIEITDVIENMIRAGERISPVRFSGRYLNLTFPGDIDQAERLFANPPSERPPDGEHP